LRLQELADGKIAVILSDNGSEFAKYFDEACRRFNIINMFSRVKTPKDNVVDERFNRTIQEEFMEVDEYFEPYLTESNLVKANERLTEWLIFITLKDLINLLITDHLLSIIITSFSRNRNCHLCTRL